MRPEKGDALEVLRSSPGLLARDYFCSHSARASPWPVSGRSKNGGEAGWQWSGSEPPGDRVDAPDGQSSSCPRSAPASNERVGG